MPTDRLAVPPTLTMVGLGWDWNMGAKAAADTVRTAPKLVAEPAELVAVAE